MVPKSGYQLKEVPSEVDCLLAVTERQVPRNVDCQNQKEDFSDKKKLHTVKTPDVTDPEGYVLFVSESHSGSDHDKTIWDQIQFEFDGLNVLVDLCFQGVDKTHSNVIFPYKKPKTRSYLNYKNRSTRLWVLLELKLNMFLVQ